MPANDRSDAADFSQTHGDPGRAAPRKGRRPQRGLPSDESLRSLALTYLQVQRSLWPNLARDGRLPAPDDAIVTELAERFRRRFLDNSPLKLSPEFEHSTDSVAASYLRYSDDNSNPRSLDQQLRLQLERAVRDGRFIPWDLVFADAAVTGTTADRRGYELAKDALAIAGVQALYIDEIGRASREAIEALRLGRLVDRLGKRLIGVSDGFDSAPASKL